ncbi:hypothetical protein E4U41_002726 [Claviceps citrina]|nr:hypothetical protein E4U41_002726 [Claviceps citrina]
MAKRVLPADRLCYFRLEDGLGWEQICPFLGIPIPDEPFPDANVQENFGKGVFGWLGPKIEDAALKLGGLVAVPVLASLAYLGLGYCAPWRDWGG